jgi:hypothetical protein
MRSLILTLILRDIKRFFGFLLERGYRICDAQYFPKINGNWVVTLESPDCKIEISSDRDIIGVVFSPPRKGSEKTHVSLESMIYFLTEGREFAGDFEGNFAWGKRRQLERLASLLRVYIDQITHYFGDNFEKYKSDLILAQRKYNALTLERHISER